MAWCRETLAGCRRPWGIAQFDLTVRLSAPAGGPEPVARWRRLEPTALWNTDGLHRYLAELFRDHQPDHAVYVSAALFSWGEATHAAAT